LIELIAVEGRTCKKNLGLVSPPQIKIESVRLLHPEHEDFCADLVELRSSLSVGNAESDESSATLQARAEKNSIFFDN
jgi:hypothetical protein